MAFLKLFFNSNEKDSKVYSKLSTTRKYAITSTREEELLADFENKVLKR